MTIDHSYTVLEVKPGTDLNGVRQSYEDLLKIWDARRFQSDTRLKIRIEDKLQEIHSAYDTLRGYFATEKQEIVAQNIIPAIATVEIGEAIQFRLVGMNLTGELVEINNVRWSWMQDESGVSNLNGKFVSNSTGNFIVTVHLGIFQATASVTVKTSAASSDSYTSVAQSSNQLFFTTTEGCLMGIVVIVGIVFIAGVLSVVQS